MKCSHIFWVFHSIFHAYGHPAILSTHPTTLEITTSHELSHRGDCIVAVRHSRRARKLTIGLKPDLFIALRGGRRRRSAGLLAFTGGGGGDARVIIYDK